MYLISVDIPLAKLNDELFRSFIEKYTGHKVPSRTIIREKYVDKIYEEKYAELQNLLRSDSIYVSLDGTTDKNGRQVVAFIAGSLENPLNGPFLINSEVLQDGTAESYYEFFEESLKMLYAGIGKVKYIVFW